MSIDHVSIPKDLDDRETPPFGVGAYRILERPKVAGGEQWVENIQRLMNAALAYFPELSGHTVTVGRADPDDGRYYARADWYNDMVFFRAEETPPMDTVFHELTHLAVWHATQDGADYPHTSEEYCSILSTSRIPADWIQRDTIAYLGKPSIPTEEWPDTCQRALDYRRENGANSHYIKRCKEWLDV